MQNPIYNKINYAKQELLLDEYPPDIFDLGIEFKWAIDSIPRRSSDNCIIPYDLTTRNYISTRFNSTYLKNRANSSDMHEVLDSFYKLDFFDIVIHVKNIKKRTRNHQITNTFFHMIMLTIITYLSTINYYFGCLILMILASFV